MRSDTAQVLGGGGFLSARPSTVETLFALEPLEIRSEMELLRAAERYAAHRTSARARAGGAEEADSEAQETVKEMLRGALHHIRFLTVEPAEFAEYDTSMLLSGPEQLAILLNLNSVNARHPMPSGFSTSRTHRRKAQLEREEAEEERLRKEEEDRKRETESEAEKQRQEAAEQNRSKPLVQRMVGLGEGDPQRPAARVRFSTSVFTLTVGFTSDVFYVRWMEWHLRCFRPALGRPHLHVGIQCLGPRDKLRRGWRCAARGHVRMLLRRARAEEVEEERGRVTFDHTFTDSDVSSRVRKYIMMGPPAYVEARARGALLTLEVELAADPPDYI